MKKTLAVLFVCALMASGVALGGTIDYPITFKENPTTGYEWTYEISDKEVLFIGDTGYSAPNKDDEMVGVGGTHTWIATGLKEGEASVTFTYARSWESSPDDPVVTMTFSVDSDLILTLVSSEGTPEKYMPNMAVVQLIENMTNGYTWSQSANVDGILALDSDPYTMDEKEQKLLGVGGVHTWIYSAVSEGTVVLTFEYARSGDKKPEATVKFTYNVDGEMKVSLMGIDGDYEEYDPNTQKKATAE